MGPGVGPDTALQSKMVALGVLRSHRVYLFETYAALARINSIRILLSACRAIGYINEQLDVNTAYLNAVIR